MMHPATQRVVSAAQELGLVLNIVTFDQSTRTAAEAASAVGCEVAQIVKSLCFVVNEQPIIALVSGANQLDVGKLAALHGVGKKRVQRADAETVKAATGFTIGGVSPFGHARPLPIFLDEDLLRFETIWAAAGTPNTVFPILPIQLQTSTNAVVADLKQ
ncbi:MAG: YbaK/EbsC family protein [Chloroflexi bacterium]|nr:YbaK/EbsC family protein [Chloroflexota bacterium]